MNKIVKYTIGLVAGLNLMVQAQVTTVPATNINPNDTLKIIVDLNLLDQTIDYVQNLIADADAGQDIYFWTWEPYEFPAGHPKANGIGGAAWKNSNPILVMTKESNRVYSWTMIPTEFYEVDAATVYSRDIAFLVKPKDGGGYGDPDRKSPDLLVKVDPPVTERDPLWSFPAKIQKDDILTVVYENARETKTSMQNLDPNNAYVYYECVLTNGTTLKYPPSYFVNMADYPASKMEYVGDGTFNFIIVPEMYVSVPAGEDIETISIVVRKAVWEGGAERVDETLVKDVKCQ